MNCKSVQQKLSTWANESHGSLERHVVERHLVGCEQCRQYRVKVSALDHAATALGTELLERDLRPAVVANRALRSKSSGPKLFAARPWVAAGAVGSMVVGSLVAMRHGSAYSASAETRVRTMELFIQRAPAIHRLEYYAEGEWPNDRLKLTQELWYDAGNWRKSDPGKPQDDVIERREGTEIVYYQRHSDSEIQTGLESSKQPVDFSLPQLLNDLGVQGAEAKAQDLGMTELDGKEVDELLIPTGNDQRTLVWLLPSTDMPLRADRQNRYSSGWQTDWRYVIEVSERLPAATFDPATLLPTLASGENGTRVPVRYVHIGANAIVEAGEPAWKTGNALFLSSGGTDDKLFEQACLTPAVAQSVRSWLAFNAGKYGKLGEVGSYAVNDDLGASITTTNQVFNVKFGTHEIKALVSFQRDEKGVWKATGVSDQSPPAP
jgi:hypothetical protein